MTDPQAERINIEQLNDAISSFQTKIKVSERSDHIVIFLGNSGTGKSTTIILLNGQEMIGYHHPYTYENILINKYPSQIQGDVKIEISVLAGTKMPAALPLRMQNGLNFQRSVKLWDMSGFGDNRGLTQILINTYFMHRILSLSKAIKIAFTISFHDFLFSNKGSKLIQDMKGLLNVFKSFKNFEKCFVLVITHCRKRVDIDQMLKIIKKITEIIPAIRENAQIYVFFQLIINKTIPIILIYQPQLSQTNQITKQNAIPQDYSKTISQFYEIVDQKLHSAYFPNIKIPVDDNTKLKCQRFANEAKNIIQQEQNIFTNQLIRYIQEEQKDTSKKLSHFQKVKQFINRLFQLTLFTDKSKDQQLRDSFNNLHLLSQKYELFKKVNSAIEPNHLSALDIISNQLIIVSFLSSMDFKAIGPQYNWVDQFYCIKQFFRKINDKKKDILEIMKEKEYQLSKIKIKQNLQSHNTFNRLQIQNIQTEKQTKIDIDLVQKAISKFENNIHHGEHSDENVLSSKYTEQQMRTLLQKYKKEQIISSNHLKQFKQEKDKQEQRKLSICQLEGPFSPSQSYNTNFNKLIDQYKKLKQSKKDPSGCCEIM